jgi:LCP family protein required for cell wall assembly
MRPKKETINQNTNNNSLEFQQSVERHDFLRSGLRPSGEQIIDSSTMIATRPETAIPNQVSLSEQNEVAQAEVSEGQSHKFKVEIPEQITPQIQTALLARRVPLDMSLPGEESPSRLREFIKNTRWHRVRLVATSGLAIILILVVTMGGLMFSQSYFKLHKVFKNDTASADALGPVQNLLKGQSNGRINVLLLGRDGGNGSNTNTTDTMVLASIDVVNDTVTLISVPNNLWVNNNEGAMNASALWQKGDSQYIGSISSVSTTDPSAVYAGFKLADQTIGQVLGVPIDYNVIVNFQALQQIVDTVGGITINVPTALVDPTMAWQNGGNSTLASAGTQTFDGKQALLYAMSKESTSESAREQRQRAVLEGIFTKVMSANTLTNPFKLTSLINALGNNVSTDLTIKQAGNLYQLLQQVSITSVNSVDLSSSTPSYLMAGNLSGQAILLPSSGLFNYGQIHSYVASELPNPYLVKENAKLLILNGTSTPGLATSIGNTLKGMGYNVIGIANTPNPGWQDTTLYDITNDTPHTKLYLEKYLHLSTSKGHISKSILTDGADFVIIIGNNEANNP